MEGVVDKVLLLFLVVESVGNAFESQYSYQLAIGIENQPCDLQVEVIQHPDDPFLSGPVNQFYVFLEEITHPIQEKILQELVDSVFKKFQVADIVCIVLTDQFRSQPDVSDPPCD